MIEFRCVVTVSTPAVWLARENIKRLTPRPCINVEYSHRVVYMEERSAQPRSSTQGSMDDLVSQSYIYQTPLVHDSPVTRTQSSIENLVPETGALLGEEIATAFAFVTVTSCFSAFPEGAWPLQH